jgi:predicted RNase H-like nuclease (RuvC/YqgF family)
MANRLTALSVKTTALALALGVSAQAAANMYRYTDENGQIVISSTIPQEATKRGYDILSNNGRVIETIPPAPTEEEIAAREAEKQRQKELAEQREQDRALLKRFSHPDQAVKAMHRKIRELEGLIQLKRGNISVISSQLDNEQSRAANMERAGREIPEGTLEKIRRLEAQIRDIEREIASQTQEIDELRKAFEDDIERLEEVTGEARTLPLDHTKTDN